MKKVLLIVPHLSTGGLPQYTLKQIESLYQEYDFYCVEWSNISGNEFIVQRNKISKLLGTKFYSLPESKEEIISIIESIQPDVIHFQEIPETFIQSDILDILYFEDRWYDIVVTTHSSNTNPETISYTADKFILVSEWSKQVFTKVFDEKICDIWEYPIEKISYDKNLAKEKLEFDKNLKHILNVGLFTSGKNQGELLDIARKMKNYPVQFHFVGNQALNFKDYWEPLMSDFPSNCVWHGERDNVEDFYKASDLFYFSSNLELNPLVVKESLSHGLPTFIKKLETYLDYYDDKVYYISNSQDENIRQILKVMKMDSIKNTTSTSHIVAMHILTDVDSEREVNSLISLSKLEDFGIEYNTCINRRYTEVPPSENCQYPEKISIEPGGKLTPGHYGCYLAHKNAVIDGIQKDKDYILIFECDAIIDVSYDVFMDKLNFSCNKIIEDDLLMFSFGYHNNTNIIQKKEDYFIVDKFYGAHAYLIPRKSYEIFSNLFQNEKWNVTDLLYAEKLNKFKIGIFEKPITKQSAGFSILDKVHHEERY
jgi:hypothetical protein